MIEEHIVEEIPLGTLLERVQLMQASGWRLAQICCTRLAADHEVSYSFDEGPMAKEAAGGAPGPSRPPAFHTLRVRLPLENPELPSVSSFYWGAFLYENEMHDLFGVNVRGMAVDFHGKLFTTAVPFPYVPKPAGAG